LVQLRAGIFDLDERRRFQLAGHLEHLGFEAVMHNPADDDALQIACTVTDFSICTAEALTILNENYIQTSENRFQEHDLLVIVTNNQAPIVGHKVLNFTLRGMVPERLTYQFFNLLVSFYQPDADSSESPSKLSDPPQDIRYCIFPHSAGFKIVRIEDVLYFEQQGESTFVVCRVEGNHIWIKYPTTLDVAALHKNLKNVNYLFFAGENHIINLRRVSQIVPREDRIVFDNGATLRVETDEVMRLFLKPDQIILL